MAVAIGFSSGNGVVVARHFGAGDEKKVRSNASTGILFLMLLGLISAVIGVVAAKPVFVRIVNVPESFLELTLLYFRIYALGLIFQFGYNIFSAILRAVGDSAATLYFLLISSVMNIALDLLFVAGFHWGVAGAAVATDISQAVSFVAAYLYMRGKYPIFRFRPDEYRWDNALVSRTVRIGLPISFQLIVVSVGMTFIQRAVNGFGQAMTASFTVGQRIEMYINLPFNALQTTLATYTGQYEGSVKATLPADKAYEMGEAIQSSVKAIALPENVSFGETQAEESMEEEFGGIGKAIASAVFLVFMVMAIQFESIKYSVLVMFCIPFSVIGSIPLLYVTNSKLNMTSLMGFLMLAGIVVNNGILLIDTTNENRKSMPVEEALITAGKSRLRPILMTTLTTILSMVPMCIPRGGSEDSMKGMALVIIGGLTASTILTFFLLPTFYMIIQKKEKASRETGHCAEIKTETPEITVIDLDEEDLRPEETDGSQTEETDGSHTEETEESRTVEIEGSQTEEKEGSQTEETDGSQIEEK